LSCPQTSSSARMPSWAISAAHTCACRARVP
jgi:hypothetical protein